MLKITFKLTKLLATLGLIVLTSLGLGAGLAAPAFAHAVETDYTIADDAKLKTNTRFSTGEPLTLAPVRVFSPASLDRPWLEGQTDAQGMFSFSPDRKVTGNWEVAIGEGNHADALTVAVSAQDIQIKEVQERAQAPHTHPAQTNPFGKQLLVVGFVAAAGGLGKLLSGKRFS
jgi:hypothetical protein